MTALIRDSSVWSAPEIENYLRQMEIPIRLACVDGSGAPLLCSLWYLYDDGVLWCATQSGANVARLLKQRSRCAFEIAGDEMPYRGVRGQGTAVLVPAQGEAMLAELLQRYLGTLETKFARWLLSRADDEVAIRITPEWLTSWDFTTRMTS